MKQRGEVVELAFHVGVEKRRVAFATAPERVAFATELERGVHRGFHLGGSVGENLRVRRSAGTLRITRVGEKAGGAPEKLLVVCLLQVEKMVCDFFQRGGGFREIVELGSDVAVVEAIVVDVDLVEELEEDVGALEGVVHGVRLVVPRHDGSGAAEWIRQAVAHDMPVSGGEAHVVAHRLAINEFVRIVVLEREGVFRSRAFVADFWNAWKKGHEADYSDRPAGARRKDRTVILSNENMICFGTTLSLSGDC